MTIIYPNFKDKIIKIIKEIIEHIRELHKKLWELGYIYGDGKFDNYGINLDVDKIKTIKFLDPTSGLFKIDEYDKEYGMDATIKRKTDFLSYGIYGQNYIYNLAMSTKRSFGVDSEILKENISDNKIKLMNFDCSFREEFKQIFSPSE